MIKRHKPQKQVIKAMEAVRRYCEKNICNMCPYAHRSVVGTWCMFREDPDNNITKWWIENAKKEVE